MRLSGRKASLFTRPWSPSQQVVLFALIGAHVAAFVGQLIVSAWDPSFVPEYLSLSDHGVSQAYAWQFFTAPLLHSNAWHFVGNMVVLYLLGRDVEAIIGARQFLFLYFFGVFAGELGHLFLMPSQTVLCAASGGVAAIFIAYATILPELEITALLLFMVPVRLKMRRVAQIALLFAIGLLIFDRSGTIGHSAFIGGAAAGWLYSHLLGFGGTSFLQRILRQRRAEGERLRTMSADKFIAEEIDPLLEKISERGLASLSRRERQLLVRAREKMLAQNDT
jgi:membrane associated rhomboid family serine protease